MTRAPRKTDTFRWRLAIGAVLIGLSEQRGSVYFPTYAVVFTFLIMVVVLAFRPQGLLAKEA